MSEFNNAKVNNGFPEGTSPKDFTVGAVVNVMWDDIGVTPMFITCTERHAHNYKGVYGFRGIVLGDSEGDQSFDSIQIQSLQLSSSAVAQVLAQH